MEDRLGGGWDAGSKGEERPDTAAMFLLRAWVEREGDGEE